MNSSRLSGAHMKWGELAKDLVHPECPMVQIIDAAQLALDAERERGVLDDKAYKVRSGALDMRRASVAMAQVVFGCPRDQHTTEPDDKYSCKLPTGIIENSAFGSVEQMMVSVNTKPQEGVGFNNGR